MNTHFVVYMTNRGHTRVEFKNGSLAVTEFISKNKINIKTVLAHGKYKVEQLDNVTVIPYKNTMDLEELQKLIRSCIIYERFNKNNLVKKENIKIK